MRTIIKDRYTKENVRFLYRNILVIKDITNLKLITINLTFINYIQYMELTIILN